MSESTRLPKALESSWADGLPSWCRRRQSWRPSAAIESHLGGPPGPSGALLRPSLSMFGSSRAHLGPILGSSWAPEHHHTITAHNTARNTITAHNTAHNTITAETPACRCTGLLDACRCIGPLDPCCLLCKLGARVPFAEPTLVRDLVPGHWKYRTNLGLLTIETLEQKHLQRSP